MTESVSNDGVSAFFDDELSPMERAEIAQLISNSATAQSELDAITRLSQELRKLPRKAASQSVLSGVMSQIQNPKLAPANAIARRSRQNNAWVKRALATAVVLLVCVLYLPRLWKGNSSFDPTPSTIANTEREEVPRQPADLPPQSPFPTEAVPKPVQRVFLGSEGELLAEKSREPKPNDQQLKLGENGESADPKAFDSLTTNVSPVPSIAAASLAPPMVDGFQAAKPASSIQELLNAATNAGERVVVVELSTSHAENALKHFETELAKNSVPSIEKRSGSRPEKLKENESVPDLLSVLFVQSTPEQITLAFDSLRKRNLVTQVQTQSTRALSEIAVQGVDAQDVSARNRNQTQAQSTLAQIIAEHESRQNVQAFGGGGIASAARRFSRPNETSGSRNKTANSPQGLQLRSAAEPAAGTFSLQAVPGNSESVESTAPPRSFQLKWDVPKDAFQIVDAKKESAKPLAIAEQKSMRQSRAQEAIGEVADVEAKDRSASKPVRILFLFRTRPQVGDIEPSNSNQGKGNAGGTQEK